VKSDGEGDSDEGVALAGRWLGAGWALEAGRACKSAKVRLKCDSKVQLQSGTSFLDVGHENCEKLVFEIVNYGVSRWNFN